MSPDMSRVAEALRAFEKGEILVVTDDDDRENEGDLIVAAAHATPEKLAFIVRHTSGIVCTPMAGEDARRLQLNPMVAENDAPLSTAFTVSVDYRPGLTTGISADERCATVRALANPNVAAGDFVRPGHIFPLVARDGGVLMRSGHTEAAVDLCKLTNLPPVGVISELVNDDGTVMRGEQVQAFAELNGLKVISVANLIAWRQRNERLVQRVEQSDVVTKAGPAQAITYRTEYDPMDHVAIVFGDIRDGANVAVRLHLESVIDDVFGSQGSLDAALAQISELGRGVVIYLRAGAAGVAGSRSNQQDVTIALEDVGNETHISARSREETWREIGIGAQILTELGVRSIELLASRERHYVGLDGFGIEITDTIIIDG